jgi:AcrR family transcriptional regulator
MPRTRLDPETRRAELISVARRLFTARGVEATAVSDIVREAGVAQGTFYWYFRSKDDVVAAVVEQMGAGWVERVELLTASLNLSPVRKLAMVLTARRRARMQYVAPPSGSAPETEEYVRLRHELDRSLAPRFRRVVARVLREGASEGDFLLNYPEETATLIVAALTGYDEVLNDGKRSEWTPALVDFVHRVTGCTISLQELQAEISDVQPFTIG